MLCYYTMKAILCVSVEYLDKSYDRWIKTCEPKGRVFKSKLLSDTAITSPLQLISKYYHLSQRVIFSWDLLNNVEQENCSYFSIKTFLA